MKAFCASFLAAVFGVATLWLATDGLQALTAESARRIAVSRERPAVPNITIETMSGEVRPLLMGQKKVVVSEFIYTSCPVICQRGGSNLARLRNKLIERGLTDRTRIVSLSFDPETDRRAELAQYGRLHNADGVVWSIARPMNADLSKLLETFGVVVIPDALGGYQHNAAMHIVAPDGRLASIVDSDDIDGALREVERALE